MGSNRQAETGRLILAEWPIRVACDGSLSDYFFRKRSKRTTSPPEPPSGRGGGSVGLGAGRHRARGGPAPPRRAKPERRAFQCPAGLTVAAARIERFELESELHRRIVEGRHRLERHRQALGHAAERQPDLEGIVVDRRSQN